MKRLVFVALVVAALMGCQPAMVTTTEADGLAMTAPAVSCTVREVANTESRANKEAAWAALTVGDQLAVGADIRTGFHSKCLLEFVGRACLVEVEALTVMRIGDWVKDGGVTKIRLEVEQGAVRAADKKNNLQNDFVIASPKVTLQVGGNLVPGWRAMLSPEKVAATPAATAVGPTADNVKSGTKPEIGDFQRLTRRKLATKGLVNGERWWITLEFTNAPLSKVLDFIAETAHNKPHEISILIDRKGIHDAGVDLGRQLTISAKGVSIAQALKLVLPEGLLYCTQEDGTVLVSSKGIISAALERATAKSAVGVPAADDQALWGKAVEGVQMSIQSDKKAYTVGENPEFDISFRNIGDADLILNLDSIAGNGQKYADAICLLLIPVAPDGKTRALVPKRPVGVAGRVADYLVPLKVGAVWTLKAKVDDYWFAQAKDSDIILADGLYWVEATYYGKNGQQSSDSGDQEPPVVKHGIGLLASRMASFYVNEPESAWSKAGAVVEGVQVRLRAEKTQWVSGERPHLLADIRNQGPREWRIRRRIQPVMVEVDGLWYRYLLGFGGGPSGTALSPERPLKDIGVTLWADKIQGWHSENDDQPLKLAPGKHTVRVAMSVSQYNFDEGQSARAVSNPVEIEILPAAPSAMENVKSGEKPVVKLAPEQGKRL